MPPFVVGQPMAVTDSPRQTDRDLASIAEARALAQRAKQRLARSWPSSARSRIDAIVDAMAAAADAAGRGVRPASPSRKPATASSADKIQKNLFSAQKVYTFIRPMKTVGVIARHEDTRVDRDRRTIRRRGRHRAVNQSNVDGHLQDPDFAQGALCHRAQSTPVRGQVHHARRGSDGRGGRAEPALPPVPSAG